LRQLVEAATWGAVLMGRVVVDLVRAGLEVWLLLRVVASTGGHVAWLLPSIDWLLVLPRSHIHHVLGRLSRLRVLMHHHRGRTTRAGVSAVRLRRWHVGVGVRRIRGVHLHLGCERTDALRNAHIGPIGGLLDHHRRSHPTLGIHELRSTLIMSHMSRLRAALIHIELRHWLLSKCELCMRCHRRRVSVLESR
jgi:hypothetical protein